MLSVPVLLLLVGGVNPSNAPELWVRDEATVPNSIDDYIGELTRKTERWESELQSSTESAEPLARRIRLASEMMTRLREVTQAPSRWRSYLRWRLSTEDVWRIGPEEYWVVLLEASKLSEISQTLYQAGPLQVYVHYPDDDFIRRRLAQTLLSNGAAMGFRTGRAKKVLEVGFDLSWGEEPGRVTSHATGYARTSDAGIGLKHEFTLAFGVHFNVLTEGKTRAGVEGETLANLAVGVLGAFAESVLLYALRHPPS
ncbi:MAG: hypothetical protein AAF658_18710 [Myxococcota bacterium]